MNSSASVEKFENWRFRIIYILIFLIFTIFVLRLFNLQILQGDNFIAQAEENRTRNISIPTERGIIYDRNGVVLARNAASYNVTITPANLPLDEGAIQEIYRQLSALIDVPVTNGVLTEEVVRNFSPCQTDLGISEITIIADTNAPYSPMRIQCDVDQKTAMIIQEKAWPGVEIEIEPIREYPTGELTAEIVGFLGPIPAILEEYFTDLGFVPRRDKVGYAGVESTLQEILGGRNGLRVVEVDVAGKILRDLQPPIQPIPGVNVKLTIDVRLQAAAKAALRGEMEGWNRYLNEERFKNGVVIAINPKTGEILALVSEPTFENNRMARFIPAYYFEQISNDPNRPLFNHAVSAEHPPGSVYKIVTGIGALNENVISPYQSVEAPGKIVIIERYSPNDPGTPREYVEWKREGFGRASFLTGVANSINVYFYKIGGGYEDEVKEGLGIWRMAEYAQALGYGQITGIELPGEQDGLVPNPRWKRINLSENWSTGDTYVAAVGQGYVLATPLQVLVSFAILANDGKYMQPTLVYEVVDQEGIVIEPFESKERWDITRDPVISILDENFRPTGEKKIVESWVIDLAKEGMRMAVTEGTAEKIFSGFNIPTSGKTGSAEYCDDKALAADRCQFGSWPSHAWYIGYGPSESPEIAVVAFVYDGTEGASVAAPIVRKVLAAYFELKDLDSKLVD